MSSSQVDMRFLAIAILLGASISTWRHGFGAPTVYGALISTIAYTLCGFIPWKGV